MDTILLLPALLGGVGGLTRGLVGLMKALSLLGVFTGMIFNFDYRLSLLAGYAGTDILEGIYKSFAVSKVYVGKGKK